MIPSLPIAALKIIGGKQEQSGQLDAINLKPGRIVDAKVLDVKPENLVQLLLSGKSSPPSGQGTLVQNPTQHRPGGRQANSPTASFSSNLPGNTLPTGQKVEVSTSLPLKPGMALTLTSVATPDGPVLKPISSAALSSLLSQSSQETDTALKILPGKHQASALLDSSIQPGRTVAAKVVDVTAQNRVELLVGNQKLMVSTQLPLTRGMDIPMKVVRSQDGIVLKPLPNPSASIATETAGSAAGSGRATSAVSTTLSDSPPRPPTEKPFQATSFQSFSPAKIFLGLGALSQLREPVLNDILMTLALKSDVRDDQFLPKIIENMGLSFEKKIADGLGQAPDKKRAAQEVKQLVAQDLKAAALSLTGMQSDPGKSTELKHISDALDNFAQLNVKSGDGGQNQDGSRFLLPFPVWREDGFDFGQIMLDMGKTGPADTKKIRSISFLLNMTALGPLRADFSILEKTITGRFLLENQETCDYLTPKVSQLRQRLSKIGYKAGNIDCQVARPEQIAPTSLMFSMKPPGEVQGFNIVV
nr:flagellar hook-length control protein FliK [uncultured Desulfobacter sp.]